jgi:cytoskeletal protein RodZ
LGAFGEKLRKQREQRGIALDAISNTTKISTRMLRALEDEHFDQLPGGVFNKGFVRAYARQVGLDEEEAITDYLAALRESQIQQQAILPDFRGTAGTPGPAGAPGNAGDDHGKQIPSDGPRPQLRREQDRSKNDFRRDERYRDERYRDERQHDHRRNEQASASPDSAVHRADGASAQVPWGKLAAVLLLVTLLLAFWNLRRHAGPKAAAMPVASPQQSSTTAPEPVSAATQAPPSSSANSLTVGKTPAKGTLTSGKMSAGTLSPGTIPSETTSQKAAPPIAAKPAAGPSAGNAPLAKITTPAAAVKEPSTFTLLIRAEKTTWVSIVADGKPVAEETLIAPAHTSIRASHEIYVRAGNAAGVSFLLNGKEYPAQGNEGEVRTYIFDASGLRTVPQP